MRDGYLTQEMGRLLRGERERAGLTQWALADRAGVSQQCVSRFETGRYAPTTSLVERLFDGLGRQVRLDVEARDADLDGDIETAAGLDEDYRTGLLDDLSALLRRAANLLYLLDGALAAFLQGCRSGRTGSTSRWRRTICPCSATGSAPYRTVCDGMSGGEISAGATSTRSVPARCAG